MQRVTYLRIVFISLLFTVISAHSVFSEESTPVSLDKIAVLEKRLVDVKHDLGIVQADIMQLNSKFSEYQRTVVYTNGPAAEIYKEIKVLEKQLVEKRRKLQEETRKHKGSYFYTRNYEELMKKKKALLDIQVLTENELKALRFRAGQEVADKSANN